MSTETDDELHPDICSSTTNSTKFLSPYSNEMNINELRPTTVASYLQNSCRPSDHHLQAEMEALEVLELTVKQHQVELMGEKALLTMGT